jgi:mannose-6-phosphate isomerase-like protein (cupin superfamily)
MAWFMQRLYKTRRPATPHNEVFIGGIMHAAIDLAARLATFTEAFQPRTVALFNGHDVMVAKLRGEYHWHVHDETDDFFLVLQGCVEIDLEDGSTVTLDPGQMFVVPKGMRHRPRAQGEAHILLIEPTGTPNSGDPLTAAPRRVI